ncbi:MAG: low molecular weight protein-tyrosine-phosphatase [Lysobacterales bacterium]
MNAALPVIDQKVSVRLLFVCLGNICRSPIVEAVARSEFARAGIDVDVASAGTGDYHVGEGADPRAVTVAAASGYSLERHRAAQVKAADFAAYDRILAMDLANLRDLRALASHEYRNRIELFLDYSGATPPREVPDPYFGGRSGFEHVVELARRGCQALVGQWRNGGR